MHPLFLLKSYVSFFFPEGSLGVFVKASTVVTSMAERSYEMTLDLKISRNSHRHPELWATGAARRSEKSQGLPPLNSQLRILYVYRHLKYSTI